MATLTIKKFPEALLARLKKKAAGSRRSVTQEVLARLEASLAKSISPQDRQASSEAEQQVAIWAELPGKWKSDLTVREELEQLYKARTRGRKVEL
ncbi:MAG: hypothetical protein M3463_01880 [Verrucomicrobiota bacterium]|nr:hypothetical protein [Verrucomicrobiota bacterium]